MKKILFPLIDTNKGGNLLSAISIFDKIDQKKFKAYFLLISTRGIENKIFELIKEKNNKNKKIYFININHNFESFFFNFFLIFKLFIFIYFNKFDLVHTNDGFLNSKFSILKIFFNFKLVIHLRNTDNSRRNYINFYLADKIICISRFVKKIIPNKFKFKTLILYNYVELFNENIKIKKIHSLLIKKNKNEKIIFYVSNLHERKRSITFLKILKHLNKNKNFIGFMFFQSNQNQYKKLRQTINENKLNNKIFLFNNFKTHYWIAVANEFKKKLLLSTSINEPLGRNLIEAILNKILVVANNSGGHREILNKKNGTLINTENIIYASQVIERLFHEKKSKMEKMLLIKEIQKKFQNKEYFIKINKIYLSTIK